MDKTFCPGKCNFVQDKKILSKGQKFCTGQYILLNFWKSDEFLLGVMQIFGPNQKRQLHIGISIPRPTTPVKEQILEVACCLYWAEKNLNKISYPKN